MNEFRIESMNNVNVNQLTKDQGPMIMKNKAFKELVAWHLMSDQKYTLPLLLPSRSLVSTHSQNEWA